MKLNATILNSSFKKNEKGYMVLDLVKKNIGSIENASDLIDSKKLKILNILLLSNNYFKEIPSNIGLFQKLILLDLSGNNISEISGLEDCKNLQVLNLSMNRIKFLSNLNSLQNLIKLDVSLNALLKIDELNLPNLEFLFLSSNALENLTGLAPLKNLKIIDFSKNKIRNFDFFLRIDAFPNLSELKANFNNISLENFKDFTFILKNIKNLESLELIGNEITLHHDYKYQVIINNINFLDGVEISEEVREIVKKSKIDEEFEIMKERARQEYLNRMKDEFNKKREYKKLIQERKKYIEQVIENRDELFQKDFKNLHEFESNPETFIKPVEKKIEKIEEWKKELRKKEKQRDSLTKKALKKKEGQQKEIIETKIDDAILNKKLYEISMSQPELWREMKRKEIVQLRKEESENLRNNPDFRTIEENYAKNEELHDNLQNFKGLQDESNLKQITKEKLSKEKVNIKNDRSEKKIDLSENIKGGKTIILENEKIFPETNDFHLISENDKKGERKKIFEEKIVYSPQTKKNILKKTETKSTKICLIF